MSDYPNCGILFRSDKKASPKDRDMNGSGELTCPHCGEAIELWLSAWRKEGRKGPFLSLSLKPKDAPKDRPAAPEPAPELGLDGDDDIPF